MLLFLSSFHTCTAVDFFCVAPFNICGVVHTPVLPQMNLLTMWPFSVPWNLHGYIQPSRVDQSGCYNFTCNGMAASSCGFSKHAQVLKRVLHATAHWGCCRNTVRESALQVNPGRKIPCQTFISCAPQSMLYNVKLYRK